MKNLLVPTRLIGLVFPLAARGVGPRLQMGRALENLVGIAAKLRVFCSRRSELAAIRDK
jgi:hypothetical protein